MDWNAMSDADFRTEVRGFVESQCPPALRHHPRCDVAHAAGGEGHDDSYRFGRVVLRASYRRGKAKHQHGKHLKKPIHFTFSLSVFLL